MHGKDRSVTMNDLVKSIRAQHINDFLKGLLLTILAGSVAFGMVYGSIGKKTQVYISVLPLLRGFMPSLHL